MIAIRDQHISKLQEEIAEKHSKIEELEKQALATQNNKQTTNESEAVKNLKFDKQILMNKLSQYKKAEKSVKDLVDEYEDMKLKYFNVLTENSSQKS